MDSEYVKYRQANLKGKLLITKRFNNFYLNQYMPMTRLEKKDVDKSRNLYRSYTFGLSVFFGFLSFRIRRLGISMNGVQGATYDS